MENPKKNAGITKRMAPYSILAKGILNLLLEWLLSIDHGGGAREYQKR